MKFKVVSTSKNAYPLLGNKVKSQLFERDINPSFSLYENNIRIKKRSIFHLFYGKWLKKTTFRKLIKESKNDNREKRRTKNTEGGIRK